MSVALKVNKLREILDDKKLDAFLVSSPPNRRYLSGFTGSAGYLLISRSESVLCTDFRYLEQAREQAPDFRLERMSALMDWFPRLASELGVKNIGIEADDITVSTRLTLQKAIDRSDVNSDILLVETSHLVDMLRGVKYQDELKLLNQAIQITDQAFEEVSCQITSGIRESEIAWSLEKAMRERGAEALAFDIIVGAGSNAALPHHRADDTVISNGQSVVIDMGAQFEGYCADLTRTVFVGQPDEKFRHIYDIVLGAQRVAIDGVKVGMTGGDLDQMAREFISEAGYGDNFGHSLGHGVGLVVHEFPRVGPNSTDLIGEGMVFTIEPGIYLSGWGGVRIEDIVLVKDGIAEVISKANK
mgnify:CR=1 FL=1